VEKLYRTPRSAHLQGTSNIQLLTIAKKLFRQSELVSPIEEKCEDGFVCRVRGCVPARLGGGYRECRRDLLR